MSVTHRLIPSGFELRVLPGRNIGLEIKHIGGGKTIVPINADIAEELGKQLIGHSLITSGGLVSAGRG